MHLLFPDRYLPLRSFRTQATPALVAGLWGPSAKPPRTLPGRGCALECALLPSRAMRCGAILSLPPLPAATTASRQRFSNFRVLLLLALAVLLAVHILLFHFFS